MFKTLVQVNSHPLATLQTQAHHGVGELIHLPMEIAIVER
jgi:hypothetical protein